MTNEIKVQVNGQVIVKAAESTVSLIVKSDRLDESQELHIRFTHEGIIADLVENGSVVQTFSNMYDEFVEGCLK